MTSIGKFIFAFILAFVLRFITGLALEGGWLREPELSPLERAPWSVLLPAIAATVTLLALNRRSPRRLLDGRVRRGATQAAWGLAAGLAAAGLSILAVMVVHNLALKAVITGVVSALVVAVALLLLPRSRGYACVHCGSVMSASDVACPGCGAAESRGRTASKTEAA